MSISIAEALGQGMLQVGRTYRGKVQGRAIEFRLLDASPPGPTTALDENDIMLDAWVELPGPEAAEGVVTVSKLGEPDLPDVPVIPEEDAP